MCWMVDVPLNKPLTNNEICSIYIFDDLNVFYVSVPGLRQWILNALFIYFLCASVLFGFFYFYLFPNKILSIIHLCVWKFESLVGDDK